MRDAGSALNLNEKSEMGDKVGFSLSVQPRVIWKE
jgi:hypothetical protein